MTETLVEGFARDTVALAAHLRARGANVRLAGPGEAGPEALALRAHGIRVDPHTDLDADAEAPDVAYLDVWTPEVAPRVHRLRAAGTRISSLSDLLLENASVPTVGITGTAGKSTTASFLVALLRGAGIGVHASTTARVGQLWATEELLPLLDPYGAKPTPTPTATPTDGSEPPSSSSDHPASSHPPLDSLLVLELTSSHLAFCNASPTVAVVTCLWPDHVELHGSVDAYVAAKERIVRHQRPDDRVVVNADDPAAARLAELTPAERWMFSAESEVERGAFLRGGALVARTPAGDHGLGEAPGAAGGRRQAALAAIAAALAGGACPERLAGAVDTLEALPHRARVVARRGNTELVDDAMAATPAKAAATLATYAPGSVVAVLGGARESTGLTLQTSPEEHRLLADALRVVARVALHVVAFGPAGELVAPRLRALGVTVETVEDIEEAIGRALARADGAAAVVVAPMFPLSPAERVLVDERLRAGARGAGC